MMKTLRTILLLAAVLAVPRPVDAQLSDPQLRQQIRYAISRTENLIDEAREAIARLQTIEAVLSGRIDVIIPPDTSTPPDPVPEPEPAPDPPSGDVQFSTSWAAGDILDGGRLFHRGGAYDGTAYLSTTNPDQAGWPTSALQINIGARDWALVGARGWQVPAVGESLRFTARVRIDLADHSAVSNEHGLQSNVGSIEHAWQFHSPQGETVQIGFYHRGMTGAYYAQLPDEDPDNIPLLLDWTVELVGPSRCRLSSVAVVDERDDTVLASGGDFFGNWGGDRSDPLGTPEWGCDPTNALSQYLFGASGSSGGYGIVLVTDFEVR